MDASLQVPDRYAQYRDKMEVGDIIAYGGKGRLSNLIKALTRSEVSHVGIVLQTRVVDEKGGRYFNQVIESTTLNGFAGVQVSRLSAMLAMYAGEVWWLPLAPEIREQLDLEKFTTWLFAQEGKLYDSLQAAGSALDLFLPEQDEDYGRLFCSELAAGGLKAGGALPASVNPSEVTPAELVRWKLYKGAEQLKGDTKGISGANSRPVA